MQALIDIIMKLVQDLLKATVAQIHQNIGYFDRGDTDKYDFEAPAFVQDNVWRDLDLSDIIPLGVKAVHLRVVIKTTIVNVAFNLRTNGNTEVRNVVLVICPVANIRTSVDCIVHPSSFGVIEYKCLQARFNVINVTVAGWWKR